MDTVKKVLGFREEGLRGLHFYIDGLEYPIVAAEYSEQDALAFRILDRHIKSSRMTSEALCKWCISHKIYFSFLYGFRIRHYLGHPLKAWRYLQMRLRLLHYCAPYKPVHE